jgi:hypothetical protein
VISPWRTGSPSSRAQELRPRDDLARDTEQIEHLAKTRRQRVAAGRLNC